MEYDNRNTGILTKNDKAGNEKRPDYRGKLNIDGKDFELAGWIRKRKADGQPFLSLTVQPAQPKAAPAPATPATGSTAAPAVPAAAAAPADEILPF